MSAQDFITELREMGFDVEEHEDSKVSFPWKVPVGKFADTEIRLGFVVPQDYQLSPPTGPHISPELLPRENGGVHPSGGVLESPFGSGWQYWSRPLNHWPQTKRTARDVMAHVKQLFATQ